MPKDELATDTEPVEVTTSVRLPTDLHEALVKDAAREERSLAQTIRYALRLYVAEAL